MRIRLYWLFLFLLITVGAFFYYQENQSPLSYAFADQFDGNDYEIIYNNFVEKKGEYQVSFPFNSRILVPYLASKMGTGDIIEDFHIVNLMFSLAAVFVLFMLWRDLGFELKWFFFGFFWLLFHWTGMIRLNAFDPITVDLPLYLFQGLFLWIIIKRKFAWLLLLGPLATLQKESFIAILAVLMAYGWYHNRKEDDGYFNLKVILIALILSLGVKQLANFYYPAVETGRGAIITILYHMRELVYHPFKILRWTAAFFVAFGPFLIATLFDLSKRNYYDNRRNLLVIFSVLYALFGIFAGGDMTRIIYLGFPFIMTLIIFELKEISNKAFWILTFLSLPLMFLLNTIPNPAFEWEAWKAWYPEFAPINTVLLFVSYTLICVLIIRRLRLKSI